VADIYHSPGTGPKHRRPLRQWDKAEDFIDDPEEPVGVVELPTGTREDHTDE
jgi:hypothetical protein